MITEVPTAIRTTASIRLTSGEGTGHAAYVPGGESVVGLAQAARGTPELRNAARRNKHQQRAGQPNPSASRRRRRVPRQPPSVKPHHT
jgi:hypothetical protein